MNILIYGGGALGKQVYYIADTYYKDKLNILGFVDDVQIEDTPVTNGLTTVGSLSQITKIPEYSPDNVRLLPAIGYSHMHKRGLAFQHAKKSGYIFETLIHPHALVEKNVSMGEGNIILSGAIIDQYAVINDFNFFDIGIKIGEHTVIKENNYFSAGATIAGSVKIGCNNFFGLNSVVVNDKSIGNNNFINSKALIYKNMDDNKKVVEFYSQHILKGGDVK